MAETEYVGVRAAAKAIGVNPSTVSRYLKDHPELNHAAADATSAIDVEELQAHRAANVNHAMSGNHAGRLQDDWESDLGDPLAAAHHRSAGGEALRLSRARAVREGTRAAIEQLDLADRFGSVAAVEVVVAACDEASAQLKQAFRVRARQIADELAGMTDPREIAAHLEASDREMLENVSGDFEQKLFGPGGEAAAA